MAAPRSENGRLAVAAGYTPGTKEYRNYTRSLQRYTTTTGKQTRRATETQLSKLSPEAAQVIRNRQAVRDAGTPKVGQRARITGKFVVGNSPAEQRRGNTARTITSAPLTPEQIQLLQHDPRAFLNADFFGLDADDADGYGVEAAQVISVSYI